MYPHWGRTMSLESIVIAEGDALARIGLRSILESSACAQSIIEVTNIGELHETLPAREPAVLVIDVHLAGLEGPDGFADLLQKYPGSKICALVDTVTREVALDFLARGVMGCIAKSQTAEELVDAVDAIASGRPYVCKLASQKSATRPFDMATNSLTRRQRKVLAVMAMGKSNKEIARELGICERTVQVHVNAAYRALGVHNRVAAVRALNNLE